MKAEMSSARSSLWTLGSRAPARGPCGPGWPRPLVARVGFGGPDGRYPPSGLDYSRGLLRARDCSLPWLSSLDVDGGGLHDGVDAHGWPRRRAHTEDDRSSKGTAQPRVERGNGTVEGFAPCATGATRPVGGARTRELLPGGET